VDEVAVIGVDDEKYGQALKAFVVTKGSLSEDDAKKYVKENLDYPYYLLRDRLESADKDVSPEQLAKGEGSLLEWEGKKVAAYRDEQGALTICSAVCTHLGCLVRWNSAARTWDCPCHGSRFQPTGEVLSGPAEEPLERLKGR